MVITIARNVRFSFLRGGGSSLEILFGKVSLTPSNLHTLSTTTVLPAPTTFDLINGIAIATNVAPTPAPVDGKIPWAYTVKVTSTKGQVFEYLVGVPDGTSEINFNVLPRYFETKPPLFGQGPQGPAGTSATVAVGTTTSGPTPAVVNSGTSTNAVLNFTLAKGDKGDPGTGVAAGGTALQALRKNAANTATEWVDVNKALVGLGNADNTSDATKPVSTAQKTYIDNSNTLAYRANVATSLPSQYPEGVTVFNVNAAPDGWPVLFGSQAQVKTDRGRGNTAALQTITGLGATSGSNPATARVLFRKSGQDDIWGDWQEQLTVLGARKGIVTNVMDFGAVGDGVTDDTSAFVAARDYIASVGGGTLYAPAKAFHISGVIEFTSNLTVMGRGATFLKLASSTHQATFIAKSNGAKGYGSGGRAIIIDGPTFKGTFSGNKGNGLSLHHVEDLIVRNSKFTECVLTGHAADLGGCRKIRFENTVFEGWKVGEGREFTEAIQLDYSTAATLGQDTIASSFDGLPTVDVVVKDCEFIPLTVGGTTYPAPNPMGTHTRVAGYLVENILFAHNLVRGGLGTTGFVGSTATFHKGWIHIGYAKNVKIKNNRFVSTHSNPTRVININAPDSAYLLSSVADPAATMTPATPIPVTDFELSGNIFENFNSGDATSRSEPIVYLRGYSETLQSKDFLLENNTYNNCSPAVEGTYQYEGQIGVNAAYISNLELRKINLRGLSQLMVTVKCADVTLDNISGYLTSIFVQDDDSVNYFIGVTDVRYPGGAQMNRTNGVYFAGTRLRTINSSDVGSLGDRLFSLSACKNILSRDVTVDNSSGSSLVTRGLWVTGTSQAGRIDQTLIRGTFSVAGVRIETNSNTVTVANSVTAV